MRKFRGQALIEYALLLGLVITVVGVALLAFNGTLSSLFSTLNDKITSAL